MWPVSEPIEKVEAKWQTSGEIKYVGDNAEKQGELHGAFVLSSRANCDVVSVNATRALVREAEAISRMSQSLFVYRQYQV